MIIQKKILQTMIKKYIFVFDTVGKSSFFKCKRLLQSGGVYISSDLRLYVSKSFPTAHNIDHKTNAWKQKKPYFQILQILKEVYF